MPLVKCPDCEKMISPRVQMCPFCGCPSSFFLKENNDKSIPSDVDKNKKSRDNFDGGNNKSSEKGKKTVDENILSKKKRNDQNEKTEDIFDEFSILGINIKYLKSQEFYISSLKLHNKLAAVEEKKFEKKYDQAGNFDVIWDEIVPSINYQIKKIIDDVIRRLYQSGISVQEDDFLFNYKIDYENLIAQTRDAYDSIIDEANDLIYQRQAERSNRSHWEGGGFGLGGAIKGAIQASAMNAVTGVGRSISDSIVDSGDRAKLQASKDELYKDRKYINNILYSFRVIVFKVDYGLAEELYKAGATERVEIDIAESLNLCNAAVKYEKNEKSLAKKLLECIMLYPTEKYNYLGVIRYITIYRENELDEIARFLKFWDMDEDFSLFFNEMRVREPILRYINQHPEIKEINYKNYNAATYIQIRDARKALVKVAMRNELPTLVSTCSKIDTYLKECLEFKNTLEPIKTFLKLDDSDTLDSICQKIQDEKKFLPEFLKLIWIKGDSEAIPEDKLKNKWGIPQSDTIYLYQNKAIFGTFFGGDGFVLSSSKICDLKSRTSINTIDVSIVSYDNKSGTVQISDGKSTISINISEEKEATRSFICSCLKEMIKITRNRASFQAETQRNNFNEMGNIDNVIETDDTEDIITCTSCGKRINRANKFCAFCGTPIISKINCPSCGKEIKADAKFCNFCGVSILTNNVILERTEEVSQTDMLDESELWLWATERYD